MDAAMWLLYITGDNNINNLKWQIEPTVTAREQLESSSLLAS